MRKNVAFRHNRAFRACCITLVLLVVLVSFGFVLQVVCETAHKAVAVRASFAAAEDLLNGASAEAVVDGLIFSAAGDVAYSDALPGVLPESLASVVGLPKGARKVRADESLCIIGYESDGPSHEAIELLKEAMQEFGWQVVNLDSFGSVGFVKGSDSGGFRCAIANFTSFEQETSAVIQLLR